MTIRDPMSREDVTIRDLVQKPGSRKRTSWWAWVLLAMLIAGALWYGSSTGGQTETKGARIAAIESNLKCPSCEGISVAESSAPTAIAIRSLVTQRVDEGENDGEITGFLVSRYGPGILLRPPARGSAGLVWFVPIAVLVVGGGAVAVVFYRRRAQPRFAARVQRPESGRSQVENGTGQLIAEFLAAGHPNAEYPSTAKRKRRNALLLGGAGLALAGAVAVVAVSELRNRGTVGAGAAQSSSANSRQAQAESDLAKAQALEQNGDLTGALKLYTRVLRLEPDQTQALSESGWIEYQAAQRTGDRRLQARGVALIEQAQRVNEGFYAPHLYLGSILLVGGDATGAVSEFSQFLGDSPPESEVIRAKPFIEQAFSAAHEPPPALPNG